MPKMQYVGANVPNQLGVHMFFKQPYSAAADAWRKSYSETLPNVKPKAKRVKLSAEEKAQRKRDREAARRQKNRELEIELYNRIERAFTAGFEGCDPIDFLHPIMEQYDLQMEDIDRIWSRHGFNGKKGFYASLIEAWDDHQADRVHDAKNGHVDDSSQFYRVKLEGDKVVDIIPSQNPWKPTQR